MKKPDNSIRIAVDYRELNAIIKLTANQLPYQQLLFSKLANQRFFAKVDNLSVKIDRKSQKVLCNQHSVGIVFYGNVWIRDSFCSGNLSTAIGTINWRFVP